MRYAKRLLAVLLAGLLLSGCGGKTKEEQALADTAAGDWELVSMSYSGMTLEKEELDNSDITMTLSLLEDGTGTMEYDGLVYRIQGYFSCLRRGEIPSTTANAEVLEQWHVELADDGQNTHTCLLYTSRCV